MTKAPSAFQWRDWRKYTHDGEPVRNHEAPDFELERRELMRARGIETLQSVGLFDQVERACATGCCRTAGMNKDDAIAAIVVLVRVIGKASTLDLKTASALPESEVHRIMRQARRRKLLDERVLSRKSNVYIVSNAGIEWISRWMDERNLRQDAAVPTGQHSLSLAAWPGSSRCPQDGGSS